MLDRLISVWVFERNEMGHPAYVIMYHVLENNDVGLSLHDVFHSPENTASTYTLILFVLSNLNNNP